MITRTEFIYDHDELVWFLNEFAKDIIGSGKTIREYVKEKMER